MENERPETIYVNYFDGIDESKTKALMAICSDIVAKQKPKTLYFLFSSNGGSVNAGITLYNFLRSLPVEIVMHNTGSIDSIANVFSWRDRADSLHRIRASFSMGLTGISALELL